MSRIDDETREEVEKKIKKVLYYIIELTKKFEHNESVALGANIMLIINIKDNPVIELIKDKLIFHNGKTVSDLKGMLYLTEGLLIKSDVDDSPRHIPLIVLPIPEATTREGVVLSLPGAPWAALDDFSYLLDTHEMVTQHCGDFDKTIQNKVKEYFSEDGEGRNIRSFVSLRLGNNEKPIGVLNIDSGSPNVLGTTMEFIPTYRALITPILRALAPHVELYARHCLNSLVMNKSSQLTPPSLKAK